MRPNSESIQISNEEYKELLLYMLFYSYSFYRLEHQRTVAVLIDGNVVYIIVIAKTCYNFKTFEEFYEEYYEDCEINYGPLNWFTIEEEWIPEIKEMYDKVLVDGTYIDTFKQLLCLFPPEFSDYITTNALPYRLYEVGFIPHFIQEKCSVILVVYSEYGYWKAVIDERAYLRLIDVETNMTGHDLEFLKSALY